MLLLSPYFSMEIPPVKVPLIAAPPPTRTVAPPPTSGLKAPPILKPEGWEAPRAPQPPFIPPSNDEPGLPVAPEPSEEEQKEGAEDDKDPTREMKPEIPMAPFDASTIIEFTVPIIEQPVEIPVPKAEVVITAGTTAAVATVGATGAAVFAKPLFDQLIKILKPLIKTVLKKLMGKKDVVYPPSVQLELPSQLRFGTNHQEPLRLHRGKPKHKGKKDDKKSHS